MKLLIASDIHGSAHYCAQLMAAVEREKPDKILLLGDLLYHGPRNALPEEYDCPRTYAMLNSLKDRVAAVRGNCDCEVDQMVLDFPILADYAVLTWNGRLIYATHGHLFGENNPPKLQPKDILLCGHTHVPRCKAHDGFTYWNPGSVSIPKENSHRGYMLLEGDRAVWKELDGDTVMETKI